MIVESQSKGPLFLTFHDNSQDIKRVVCPYNTAGIPTYLLSRVIFRYLNQLEAPIANMAFLLPDATPLDGVYVADTADMFAALEGDTSGHRSMESMCNHLKIKTEYLHNAGNDAYVSLDSTSIASLAKTAPFQYTLSALKSMASGNQLDIQRDERWPNRMDAESKLKVQFKPWEEGDHSDTEGLIPMPPADETSEAS